MPSAQSPRADPQDSGRHPGGLADPQDSGRRPSGGLADGDGGRHASADARAELARLERENERQRALLDNITDVVWRIDLETLRCVYVSPSVVNLTGYAPDESVSRTLPMMLTESSLASTLEVLQDDLMRYRRTGRTTRRVLEFEQHCKDGSTRWVRAHASLVLDEQGRPVEIQGVSHDITERRHAEQALRASEERYRALVESSPDFIAVHDGERILFINSAGANLLGRTDVHALVGSSVFDVLDPGFSGLVTEQAGQALNGEPTGVAQSRIRRADGTWHEVEVTSLPVTFNQKPAVQMVLREFSERQKLAQRLTVADRLSSLGTLAAGAAHQINNPLASLVATLDFVREELHGRLERGAEIEQALAEASDAAQRIARIVGDLKTFARADEDALRPVDVREVLDSMIALGWNEIRHRALLQKKYQPVPLVMANEGRLGSVFLNLIMNALHAIPEDGGPEHEVVISVCPARQGGVEVEVRDTGVGIPAELLDRIFEPFFTTKGVGEGRGLGLSVCHSVITALGGEISVESTPRGGSTFRVRLPAAPAVAEAAVARSRAPASQSRGRTRVLVIDDDPVVGNALRRALRQSNVSVVRSGRAAILAVREADPPFDVIVCDLMMPEMSGMDVYEQLSTLEPAAAERMVFVTGGAFTPRARRFLETVNRPSMLKPFDSEALRELIERVARETVARVGLESRRSDRP